MRTSAPGCPIAKFHQIIREGSHFIYGSQRVKVYGNAKVVLYDNAHAEAHDDAVVHAIQRASVELFDRATCYASDGTSVTAYHGSSVHADEYAQVKLYHSATGQLAGHARAWANDQSKLTLYCWTTAELFDEARIELDLRSTDPDPAYFYLPVDDMPRVPTHLTRRDGKAAFRKHDYEFRKRRQSRRG